MAFAEPTDAAGYLSRAAGYGRSNPQAARYNYLRAAMAGDPTAGAKVVALAAAAKGAPNPEADAFIAQCRSEFGLTIDGLMCIPPADENPAPHFALLEKIARRNRLMGLSMGMSADFETAIAFGATHVRIGSAIFGGR